MAAFFLAPPSFGLRPFFAGVAAGAAAAAVAAAASSDMTGVCCAVLYGRSATLTRRRLAYVYVTSGRGALYSLTGDGKDAMSIAEGGRPPAAALTSNCVSDYG